jgi:membrane-associated phospholipid phosphatase
LLEQLNQWDTQLFLLVNKTWANSFFDWLMPLLREKWIWLPLYLLLIGYFYKTYRLKNTLYILLFAVAMVVVGNSLLADVVKKTTQRPRPCQEETLKGQMIERVGCGGMYGYFSAHATNHFALALFFLLLLKKRFRWATFALLFWAAAIAYAQVYVGKHYPFDVLTGAIVGSLLGWLTYRLLIKRVKDIQA